MKDKHLENLAYLFSGSGIIIFIYLMITGITLTKGLFCIGLIVISIIINLFRKDEKS